MRIAIIQSGNTGFFPRFYGCLKSSAIASQDDLRLFCPNSGINRRTQLANQITFGSRINWYIHYHIYKIIGLQDLFSQFSTLDLIKKLKEYKPDVIHLHVVNAWIINFPLLVHYVNKYNIKVIWTMHDCRAFTGRCAYFDEVSCEKWKYGCGNCPQKQLYWPTMIDSSAFQWKFRNKYFNKIKDLHIITPSKWLADYVKKSFLKKFPVDIIYNGLDLELFSKKVGSFHCLDQIPTNKVVILGVAANWEFRKGLEYFKMLAYDLPENYQIVLVGEMDNKDGVGLPKQIIQLGRTSSFEEMLALYQRATVFANPTLADNFPTTNIEALASGTPVVTFITGGSAESIDENSGIAVPKADYQAFKNAIIQVCTHREDIFTSINCIMRSHHFSLKQFDKYIDLYHAV